MRLIGDARIRFGNVIFGEDQLRAYRERKPKTLSPETMGMHMRERDGSPGPGLLFALLGTNAESVTITADPHEGPLLLEAAFKGFPYAINNQRRFAAYGIALVPVYGKVDRVEVVALKGLGVAVNGVIASFGETVVDLGNGHLRLKIRRSRSSEPVAVEPPAEFRENRYGYRDYASC